MPNLFEEFRAVVAALGSVRVPYAICAGIAMSIHAHPRATIAIDLLAPPEAVVALDVIEVRPGVTEDAWQTRTGAEWEGRASASSDSRGCEARHRTSPTSPCSRGRHDPR
jgi:hypothetical protein